MPNKEEIKKSIDKMVEEAYNEQENKETAPEAKQEEVIEKATQKELPKESHDQNGGHDKMKTGSPYQEKQELAKKDEKKKKKDLKKSEEQTDSQEELKKTLTIEDEDEIELIKAWRSQKDESKEEISKSETSEDKSEDLAKAFSSQIDSLQKSLAERDELIKSLSEKVEKIASQPAYDKRSISNLETIEKSEGNPSESISKSQVLDKMLELQQSKKVHSTHIAEFEATGDISNPVVKKLVMESFK